jgi:glycosyltransferase involved in cell wall biosynthesis
VVDYGGPGELVTAATGIKVGLGERDDIVPAMADAITRLIAEPETVERMAAAGRQRIETLFSWRRKAQQVTAVYDWVLADLPERPCFGFLDKELGLS